MQEYQLISKGIPQQGFSRDEVENQLKKHVGNASTVEKLLCSRSLIVKRSNEKATLEHYAQILSRSGLEVELRVIETPESINIPEQLSVSDRLDSTSAANKTPVATPDDDVLDETNSQQPQKIATHERIDAENSAADHLAPDYPDKVSRYQRIKYAFDNFMASGSSAMFKALVVVFVSSLLVIGLFRALFFSLFPSVELQNQTGFFGNLYTTFLQLTDPGNMAQDIFSSGWYKLFAVVAGIVGVTLFSSLIAFITSALEQKMRELRQGRSKVIETDHTLIIGWNEERIIEILREIILANESEDYGCVVILADQHKEEMDHLIRLRLPDHKTTRIVTRSGKVTLHGNLLNVAIEQCKSVIVLADCKDTDSADMKAASDAKVIQTILAVTAKAKEQAIVAELFDTTYQEIVESTLTDNITIVNSNEILAKLLVQTSRSVGLSVVYSELLSFDGCEIYFYENDWPGVSFADLAFYFHDGVPLGYKDKNGQLHLNPQQDYRLQSGDELIIVADDDSTIAVEAEPVYQASASPIPDTRLVKSTETELLIGWNQKTPIVIEEFAEYVIDGTIDVLIRYPDDGARHTISELNERLENLTVNLVEKNHLNRDELLSLDPCKYDNIIIFSTQGRECDAQQVDSENIVCLLLLRHIFQEKKEPVTTKLITEVMDSQNHSLVSRAGVKDIIISSRLLSMVMAQISENRDIKMVYDDIFSEDGSEIYLKPASLYFNELPATVSFGKMMRQVQARDEVCIGVKLKASERDADANFGVQLIPEKSREFTLGPDDCLVVLAEDEL